MRRAKHLLHEAWAKSKYDGTFSEYKRRCSPTIDNETVMFYCCEKTVTLVLDNQIDIDAIKLYVENRNATCLRDN